MELGRRLKQARLESGLSQRQLCEGIVTRNMLSQIENGTAHPSMETLRQFAQRLGKPVSYFLEENAILSPNQQIMAQARLAWAAGDLEKVCDLLKDFREPDPAFQMEKELLETMAVLKLAQKAVEENRNIYAVELLENLQIPPQGYCCETLNREKMLILGEIPGQDLSGLCEKLPSLDGELLMRAQEALRRDDGNRAGALLDAAENRANPQWNYLRGEAFRKCGKFREAANCYHQAETAYPRETVAHLEQCYRELEDFKQAYYYACRQR